MKYELNETQVFFVEEKLSELGLNYIPLKEEFLDHICCLIEERIGSGKTFNQASQMIFEAIGKDELKELQQQTIFLTNQRSRRMKNVILVFSSSLVLLTGFLFFLQKENIPIASIQPPSPTEVELLQEKNFSEIACKDDYFEKKKNKLSVSHDPPSISPLAGDNKITSKFGMRFHPVFKKRKFHRGMDFRAPIGTPVLATSNGEIVKVKMHKNGYGKHIVIKHDNQFKTLYAHLDEIKVTQGQMVKIGEVIGTVGNTGESMSSHLHYEVIKDGKAVDPIAYCNP